MKPKTVQDIYWGIVLVALGAIFLAGNVGLIEFRFTPRLFRVYWPIILILIGGSILIKSMMKKGEAK